MYESNFSSYNNKKEEAEKQYQLGKEAELEGDLQKAISFYRRAERLGHNLEDAKPSSNQCLSFPLCKVPIDSEGFVQSFSLSQREDYTRFFHEYGFVVVNNILSDQEISASIDGIWKCMQEGGSSSNSQAHPLDRHDPRTWEVPSWSSSPVGIIGNDIFSDISAWNNRQSPHLFQIAYDLLQTNHLLVSPCRFGVMRPTKSIPFPVVNKEGRGEKEEEGKVELIVRDKPEWRTKPTWFHWDLNPWEWFELIPSSTDLWLEPQRDAGVVERMWGTDEAAATSFLTENNSNNQFLGYPKLQGLFSFSQATERDGGLQLIPGFQHHLKTWAINNPQFSSEGLVMLPDNDPLLSPKTTVVTKEGEPQQQQQWHYQKVTQRKGSVVIWNSCLPHCNYPADGENFRYCQYFKVFPAALIQPNLRRLRKQQLQDTNGDNNDTTMLTGEQEWKWWLGRQKAIRRRLEEAKVQVTELGQTVFGLL
jgi:ectoine hydroxylase-related dioxygenase (phytanoyl-CoA dioxygenase family)